MKTGKTTSFRFAQPFLKAMRGRRDALVNRSISLEMLLTF
nr:MAG TPA: hypothetical protein [Caudoviricetes sp.]DAS50897.1 MAG TPA: hypothetical protein [Caudoviricetes sp.]